MKSKQEKLLEDYNNILPNDHELTNLCLCRKQDENKNLYIDHISFSYWYDSYSLNFKAYLNNDLKTYKIMQHDKVILKKVQPTTISKTLNKYEYDLIFKSYGFNSFLSIIKDFKRK